MTGLRERKKAKTRRTIQEQALRLFAERGYDATTVDQIADAAEISPSTFFRYFATKEDVVIEDEYDPILIEAFLRQPPTLGLVAAMRAAMHEIFTQMFAADQDELLQRSKLQFEVPAIRARLLTHQFATMERFAVAAAQRVGRDPSDLAIQAFAGAIFGTLTPAVMAWVRSEGKQPLPALVEVCFDQLESGFDLDMDTTQAA